uniref:uncharacterized protein LOC114605317 isoform X3 n=1 Tax=Podarcis muralis TaxID=64176 RepID=UPI00109F11F3|nr:uncharacterized protein LOC114605317 isoform X3 [Podarcis muralis]
MQRILVLGPSESLARITNSGAETFMSNSVPDCHLRSRQNKGERKPVCQKMVPLEQDELKQLLVLRRHLTFGGQKGFRGGREAQGRKRGGGGPRLNRDFSSLKRNHREWGCGRRRVMDLGEASLPIRADDKGWRDHKRHAHCLAPVTERVQGFPTKELWREKLTDYAELVKLTHKLSDKGNCDFKEEWEPFTKYLKKQQNELDSLAGFE